jgi:hypothetical protein
MTSLVSLPTEILIKSLINLELPDILRICRTNHQINLICNDEYFWLEKLRKDFPLVINDENILFKDFYRKVYNLYNINFKIYMNTTPVLEYGLGISLRNPIPPFDFKEEEIHISILYYRSLEHFCYIDIPDIFFIPYTSADKSYQYLYTNKVQGLDDYIVIYRPRGSNKMIYELLSEGEGVIFSPEKAKKEVERLALLGYKKFFPTGIKESDKENFIKYGFIRIF